MLMRFILISMLEMNVSQIVRVLPKRFRLGICKHQESINTQRQSDIQWQKWAYEKGTVITNPTVNQPTASLSASPGSSSR